MGAHLRAKSQPLQSAIRSRLGGFDGNAGRLGDLFKREIEVVAKYHSESLVGGKPVECAAQIGDRRIGLDSLHRCPANEPCAFDDGPPAVSPLPTTLVGDDSEQPRLQIGVAPKLPEVTPRVEQSALHCIFSV